MKIERLELPDVMLVTPIVRSDARGAFHEAWQLTRYRDAGLPDHWVQDNVSRSRRGVLRGMHFQNPRAQGKLVSVLLGEIFDVAVDLRRGSPTFGRYVFAILSATSAQQLFVPPGFAHGFVVTSDEAVVHYKCTERYLPESERTIAWNDPVVAIDWPLATPILSARDAAAKRLDDMEPDELPAYEGA